VRRFDHDSSRRPSRMNVIRKTDASKNVIASLICSCGPRATLKSMNANEAK
jgi:hypothetical protein